MTLRMRAIWAHDLKMRLGRERYRIFVRVNGGVAKPVDAGHGAYNRDYCADPFLFRHGGANWLFFETLDKTGKGVLGCLRQDGDGWTPQGLVLEEPWHLSYPQVFEEDGRVYMIPESCDAKGDFRRGHVALYEAVEFPGKWRKVATLIDRPFADATLFKKDGRYYLSCYKVTKEEDAEIWQSPSLAGPWTKHPQSGNTNQSKRLRRNGGAFQAVDGQLYRIAQDGNGGYGKRLFMVPVLELSPDRYREGDARPFPLDSSWPRNGMWHTYNKLSTPEGLVEVIDFKDYVPYPPLVRALVWARTVLHTMFRMSVKRGKGFLIQAFGVQIIYGSVKERPALLQLRIGRIPKR